MRPDQNRSFWKLLMIRHDESGFYFLNSQTSQMVVGVFQGRWPFLYHWGAPLDEGSFDRLSAVPNGYSVFGNNADKSFTPNRLPLEYPWGEVGDFRSPAFAVQDGAGRPAIDFELVKCWVEGGKPQGGPLPGARVKTADPDIQTLIVHLADRLTGLDLELHYTPIDKVLVRRTRLFNRGTRPLTVTRAFSFSVDLHPDRELDVIALDGAWARERQTRRFDLPMGRWEAGSRRGVSSHQAWPGVVLCDHLATENSGDAWGAALVWSGDWTLGVERDEDGGWRVQGGLHPEFFHPTLGPGEEFWTPEAVLVHSSQGLSGLSAAYHEFVIERLLPPAWAHRPRPVLANNWEATYWAFSQDKLLALADRAAAAGVEVFVLDDGWFGHRDDDKSSLGDWTPHPQKFPQGLRPFAEALNQRHLDFGVWIEPEMVSPDSELYRTHPEWCLHLEGRSRSESRHQLVLDLTRQEVRNHIFDQISTTLASAPIAYVKWDMNRPFSHAGVDRYQWVLGVYDLASRLTSAFPEVLFEGCCGGGGRMDFGLLYYFPQYWTSDNTDAVARLGIQEGTSLFLPPLVMGSHVSAVPNHQTGRITTWSARTRVAFGGNLGYELDFTALPGDDLALVGRDVAWYKAHRGLIQQGRFRRTRTTTGHTNTVAWQYHSANDDEVLLLWFRPQAEANSRFPLYRWEGLVPDAQYQLIWWADRQPPSILTGAELMHRGLAIPLEGGDGDGVAVHLTRIID